MGLFNRFFGKKDQENNSDDEGAKFSHDEEWDLYFSTVDDKPASFTIDLGLAKIAPVADKTNLILISVNMNDVREDGLSSNEEFETLTAVEDRLLEFLIAKHHAIYAGRLTSNGVRKFYFYMGDTTDLDKTTSQAMSAYPGYTFNFGVSEDQLWETYFDFLYPQPAEFQSIKNRQLVDLLQENGDNLTKEREVEHWIYFKTDNDRKSFIAHIARLNFNIISADETTSSEDYPYKLHL